MGTNEGQVKIKMEESVHMKIMPTKIRSDGRGGARSKHTAGQRIKKINKTEVEKRRGKNENKTEREVSERTQRRQKEDANQTKSETQSVDSKPEKTETDLTEK